MGAGGAALAEVAAAHGRDWFWLHEMGRDLVIQGSFTGIAVAAARSMRREQGSHLALHLAAGAIFIASFWVGRRFGEHLGFAIRAAVTVWLALPLRPQWEFGPRNLRRSFAHLALWMLAMGNAWVAIAPQIRRAGLHVIFLGCFTALMIGVLFPRSGEQPAFPLRKLAWAGGLVALSLVGRVMVPASPDQLPSRWASPRLRSSPPPSPACGSPSGAALSRCSASQAAARWPSFAQLLAVAVAFSMRRERLLHLLPARAPRAAPRSSPRYLQHVLRALAQRRARRSSKKWSRSRRKRSGKIGA